MLKKERILYMLFVVVIIIPIGLLSRHINWLPLWIGDFLYAVMFYFGVRTLFLEKPIFWVALVAVSLCYMVEISQLYKADWIAELRGTTFGKLVLGKGFLWSDLAAYAAGGLFASLVDSRLRIIRT